MINRTILDQSDIATIERDIYQENPFTKKYDFVINGILKKCWIVEREGYFGEPKFDVIDLSSPLGAGTFGAVYPVLTTLEFNIANQLIEKPNTRKYVFKANETNEHTYVVANEAQNAKKVPSLRAKMTKLDNHFVMADAGEQSLFSLIEAETFKNYNYKNQLALIIAILRAVQEFHQSSGLVHLDIKPNNFMVDVTDRDHPIVRLIDVGLSKERGTATKMASGNAFYADPYFIGAKDDDVFQCEEPSDVISTARTLEELFSGKNFPGSLSSPLEAAAHLYEEKNNSYIDSYSFYYEKFKCSEKKDDAQDILIKWQLEQMLKKNPQTRATIDKSITFFEELYLNETTKNNEALTEKIKKAEEIAKKLRTELTKLNSLKIIRETILKALAKLDNSPAVVEHFLDTLHIRHLHGCKTITEIKDKLNNLHAATVSEVKTFLHKANPDVATTYTSFQRMLHNKVFDDTRRSAFYKLSKCKTIDDHVEFLDKMKRLNQRVDDNFKLIIAENLNESHVTLSEILKNRIRSAYKISIDPHASIDITDSKMSQKYYSAYTVCQNTKNLDNTQLTAMVKDELYACRASRFFIQPKSRLEKQLEEMTEALNKADKKTPTEDSAIMKLRHALLTYTYRRERSWLYKLSDQNKKNTYQECMNYARTLADQILKNKCFDTKSIDVKIVALDPNLKQITDEYALDIIKSRRKPAKPTV